MTVTEPGHATVTATAAATQVALLQRHYDEVILSAWRGAGFNPAMGLPFEALDGQARALPPQRYRAMACARQIYVFARAGEQAHAERLLASLDRYFRDSDHGGWHYSIDADGRPLDTSKDLYTHAFVIFACAEVVSRFNSADAATRLRDTLEVVERHFEIAGRDGLLDAALDRSFARALIGPAQNPLMHLVEACLAAREALADASLDAWLERLGEAVCRTFTDPRTGCVLELPCTVPNNRIEPGHQFEWFYLVHAGGRTWAPPALQSSVERAYAHAVRYGVDASSLGVRAAIGPDGRVLDATQRIWAQTEYLRALAIREGAGRVLAPLVAFRERFMRPSGWIESRAATGAIQRDEMPSTTPYHLCTALAALRGRLAD